MEIADVLAFLDRCTNKTDLKTVRDRAERRLHEVEHADQWGAGQGNRGKPVEVPGAKRQP